MRLKSVCSSAGIKGSEAGVVSDGKSGSFESFGSFERFGSLRIVGSYGSQMALY